MPYTLWSRGRLLGHSDLGFRGVLPGARCGWFHPSEAGEPVIQLMTAPSRVVLHFDEVQDRATLHADLESAGDRIDALDLVLRAPDGSVVMTEDIGITDTELSAEFAAAVEARDTMMGSSLAEMLSEEGGDDGFDVLEFEDVDFDDGIVDAEEVVELPRYQIIVFLAGHEEAVR